MSRSIVRLVAELSPEYAAKLDAGRRVRADRSGKPLSIVKAIQEMIDLWGPYEQRKK